MILIVSFIHLKYLAHWYNKITLGSPLWWFIITHTHTHTHTHTPRCADSFRNTETQRPADLDTYTETPTHIDTYTERDTEVDTDK